MSPRHCRQIPPILAGWLVLLAVGIACPAGPQAQSTRGAVPPGRGPSAVAHWQTFTTRDGLPHDNIRAIRVVDGQVWVGTDGGLALRRDATWTSWTTRDGLHWPVITAIDVDPQTRDLWLGTWGGGLIRFSGGRFDQFRQRNSGLAGNLVFAVLVQDGRVWAATNAGVSSYDPSKKAWELFFERTAGEPQSVVTSLCLGTSQGSSLCGAQWLADIWERRPGEDNWARIDRETDVGDELGKNTSAARRSTLAITTSDQVIWCAEPGRLMRRDPSGDWTSHRTTDPTPDHDEMAYCLAATGEDEAWIGTDHGIQVLVDWKTDTWITYARDAETTGGLVSASRAGRRLGTRTTPSSLPDNRIRAIAFQEEAVWVGTVRGLALGTGRTPWDGLGPPAQPDRAAPSLPPSQPIQEPGATPSAARTPNQRDIIPIAALAPMAKLIALPDNGASTTQPRLFVDRVAVKQAVRRTNDRGAHPETTPFVLAINPKGYDRYGWGTPQDEFPAYAYEDGVAGFVGLLGPGDTLTSAAALHTAAPFVNAALTPAGPAESINPWVFRCRANDPRQHEMMLDYVFDHLACSRIAILRCTGGIAQLHLDWWARHARRRGHPPVADLFLNPEAKNLGPQLRALRRAKPDAVFTWCNARLAAGMVKLLRQSGMTPVFVAGDEIVREKFIQLAGDDCPIVIAIPPCAHRQDAQGTTWFNEAYVGTVSRTPASRRPAREASFAFDAANHLMEAINAAGTDHLAVRETLRKMNAGIIARLDAGQWKTIRLSAP